MVEKNRNSKVLHGQVIEPVNQEKEYLYARMENGKAVTCCIRNHASLGFGKHGEPIWKFRPVSTDLSSLRIGEKIRAECLDDWANYWIFEYEIALQRGNEFFDSFLTGVMLNDGKTVKVDGQDDESRYYHFVPENRSYLIQNEDGDIQMLPAEPAKLGYRSEIKFLPGHVPEVGQTTLHWISEGDFKAFVKSWKKYLCNQR